MEFTVQNLEEAVALFYRAEANQQAEAHQWLNEAQNSRQAWSFVWDLLDPQRNFQVQFFAATTLHTKLMKHWDEVPEDHYEYLKKKILEAIVNYAMGPKIVLNRLCIALSAYVIHTIPTHWPNAFEELVSSFQPHNLPTIESERVIWILLEILTVIPEEFQSTTLSRVQRNRVRTVLQEVSKDILKVVEMCLMPLPDKGFDMMNLTTYLTAARCGSAWMQPGGLNIQECDSICNLLIDLICYVYWNKSDPECLSGEEMELSEVAVEALTAIVQHPDTSKYTYNVTKFVASMLYKFEKIIDTEIQTSSLNKDVITNLYGLIITVADSHSKIFIDNLRSGNTDGQRISFDLFSSILKCTNLPGLYPTDESSSTMTFGFWYTLQEDILSFFTADCPKLLLMVKPYYRELVCVLLRKSMLPLVDDTSWTLDDKEVFRCYRQDIADTYIYCYNTLNLEMLDILSVKLNEVLNKEGRDSSQPKWNEIETCLHAFYAIAESIEMENLYLPKLMETIKEIPFSDLHVKVLGTALETIGAYSEWLTDHPELLGNVLPLVISCLGNPEVSTSATLALKDITHSCQKLVLPYVDHILITAQVVIQSGSLKLTDSKRLMYSIGRVLSIMPMNRVMEYLNVTLAPTFEEIQKLVLQEPSPSVAMSLISRLKLLSALFNSLYIEPEPGVSVEQPVYLIMKNTMSFYKKIAENYCDDMDVMLDLSMLFKYVLTTLKDDCKPLIEDILQIIVRIYIDRPQMHILVVAKTVLILFGKEPGLYTINQQLVQEICNRTLLLCSESNNKNQLSDIADVLEGFFILLTNLIKKVPQLLFANKLDTAALFQCAILCLVLPETQTVKAVSSFLVNFITQSREMSQVDIVQTYGESLVLRILLNLGSTTPRSSIDLLSDILLALNKKYCDNLSRWLNSLLTQENFPSPRISAQQKNNFIKIVLREKANKMRLCQSVLEFALTCRGMLKHDSTLP
ncbi:importin-13 [Euwallacea fornicatus]|uniref:importin-13 n=1 Tax=Euwallacea fornicatus TaxID=995702 RepID=UPI00338EDFA5